VSAVGGIYNFDEAPVNKDLLAALGEALTNNAPDGGGEFLLNSIGMVYRAFHTTKESRQEIQPLSDAGHVLCWDGRLDNRDELIPVVHDELFQQSTDVAIVLACYRRWGMKFLARVIGDFALSLWDASTRTLLLARDPVGPRPLFYRTNKDRIIWSSDISPLLEVDSLELEVEDEYVAGYLTRDLLTGLSPYKGIYAVPPGHFLMVRNGQVRVQRFWYLNPTDEIRYRTDAEYEDHFRHLFREAVRCRLRVDGPVWAQLSGGLDSSSIVCVADEILANDHVEATRLETVSYVYGKSTTSDETQFIRLVEDKRGRNGFHLREEEYPPLKSISENYFYNIPDFLDCFAERHKALCEAMTADGARVLLTGHGGDEMMCSGVDPSLELTDLLFRFSLLRLNNRIRAWSRVLKKSYFNLLLQDAALQLLPRRVRGRLSKKPGLDLPPWFDRPFVASMNLRDRNLGSKDVFGARLPSRRRQVADFLSASSLIATGGYRERGYIEASHPYLHVPLVTFLQAIPIDQKLRPGQTRSLMRRALRELLPERVLNRKSKRGPDAALFGAVACEWQQLQMIFANPLVCSRGYVDANELRRALERARHGCERYSFALIKTISLEFWLRTLEHRGSKAKSRVVQAKPLAESRAACSSVLQNTSSPTAAIYMKPTS